MKGHSFEWPFTVKISPKRGPGYVTSVKLNNPYGDNPAPCVKERCDNETLDHLLSAVNPNVSLRLFHLICKVT